jgi:hypothetical protein
MPRELLELVSKSECKLIPPRNHPSPRTSLILLVASIQASTTRIPFSEEASDRVTKLLVDLTSLEMHMMVCTSPYPYRVWFMKPFNLKALTHLSRIVIPWINVMVCTLF